MSDSFIASSEFIVWSEQKGGWYFQPNFTFQIHCIVSKHGC